MLTEQEQAKFDEGLVTLRESADKMESFSDSHRQTINAVEGLIRLAAEMNEDKFTPEQVERIAADVMVISTVTNALLTIAAERTSALKLAAIAMKLDDVFTEAETKVARDREGVQV